MRDPNGVTSSTSTGSPTPAPPVPPYVAVRASYGGTGGAGVGDPVDVELVTPFGSRTVPGVAPGANAYQSFSTRAASLAAGTASVRVTDAAGRVTEHAAPFAAFTC